MIAIDVCAGEIWEKKTLEQKQDMEGEYINLVSFPDPTAYVGSGGTGWDFVTPAGMSAEPIRLLFALLHNLSYDMRDSNTRKTLNTMCNIMAKDGDFGIENSSVRAAISTAVQQ